MEEKKKEMRLALTTIVRKWVTINTDMSKLSAELSKKKKAKKEISAELYAFMENNSIENVNINATDSIERKQTRSKKAMSIKFITTQLSQIYSETPSEASNILKIILDNREERVVDTIKCTTKKPPKKVEAPPEVPAEICTPGIPE